MHRRPLARTPRPFVGLRLSILFGLLATLALLLAHAGAYAFLTDDAFISFRYARNLSEGHGLVFNPGFERVEGYTNFLWVLILAAGHALGFAPETAAPVLSMLATVALWAVLAGFLRQEKLEGGRIHPIWVALVLLGATRSVAVWSTSGLETRLFELLVVAGALRLLVEDEALERQEGRVRPMAALLLALATLTRPDGLLVAACALGSVIAWRSGGLRGRRAWTLRSLGIYVAIVGGHYLFRLAYYGQWLPNTYHAKVGGRAWWAMGGQYLASFALEYAVYLWAPLLAAAVIHHRRRGTLLTPALFAAVILPHALYVASVGGDHFEFRPLDLYFPFLYVLLAHGAAHLARGTRATIAVVAWLLVVLVGVVELPYRSRVQFPDVYVPGFPGQPVERRQDAASFLDPRRSPIYGLPGAREVGRLHQELIRRTTRRFVGIRQEEHALFLATVVPEGRELGRLVDGGILPADVHVAIDCVGAIPYYANLRTLDRLGLTDASVARADFANPDIMAHGKYASWAYARERGVDLWADDHVHLLWERDSPRLARRLTRLYGREQPRHFAGVGNGRILLVWLPGGLDEARRRFPALQWQSTHDAPAIEGVIREAQGEIP